MFLRQRIATASDAERPLSGTRSRPALFSQLPSQLHTMLRVRRRKILGAMAALIGAVLVVLAIVSWSRQPVPHPYLLRKAESWDRWFDEPDFGLNSGPFPHEVGCNKTGTLALMGIFSTAAGKQRRDLLRHYVLPDYKDSNIEVKFIIARPNLWREPEHKRAAIRDKLKHQVRAEMDEHDDIIVLPVIDNIDEGKSLAYFKYLGEHYKDKAPQFVMKVDDDSIWSVPNVVSSLSSLDCSRAVYWGTSGDSSPVFHPYFRGMGYAVSWPLVEWLGRTSIPHSIRVEDARISQLLRQLDPVTDPVQRVDLLYNMADWNQVNATVNTMCLHWLKDDEWVIYNHQRLLDAWKAAGIEYAPGNGMPHAQIVETGNKKVRPTECFGWFQDHCVASVEKRKAKKAADKAARRASAALRGEVFEEEEEEEVFQEFAIMAEKPAVFLKSKTKKGKAAKTPALKVPAGEVDPLQLTVSGAILPVPTETAIAGAAGAAGVAGAGVAGVAGVAAPAAAVPGGVVTAAAGLAGTGNEIPVAPGGFGLGNVNPPAPSVSVIPDVYVPGWDDEAPLA